MTQTKLSSLQIEFANIFQTYEEQLRKYSASKVSNSDLAADLVQDTFMRTWGYIMKGGKIATMKAFLYHVLNNLIIDEYRRRKVSSLDDLLEDGYEPKSDVDDLEHNMDMLDGQAVAEKIERLSTKYRDILTMY